MLEPARSYYVRIREGGRAGPALRVIMPAEVIKSNVTEKMDKNTCNHRGKVYKIGAEWYDDCLSICMCGEGTKIECITIECPTDFGLDVLDPHCVDWETVPPNFVPKAPNCCPQVNSILYKIFWKFLTTIKRIIMFKCFIGSTMPE